MLSRGDVVKKAREYLETPFGHQGRLKGRRGRLDCVGLPLCVAEELGLRDVFGVKILGSDYLNYAALPSDDFVHREFQRRAIEVPIEEMQQGHVATILSPALPCHAAIVGEVSGYKTLIHCYAPGIGKCVEHILDHHWRKRIVGVFLFPGVEA